MQETDASPRLPEQQRRRSPTAAVNIIGGPGGEKSLFTDAIILQLHRHHKSAARIPNDARAPVWQKHDEAVRVLSRREGISFAPLKPSSRPSSPSPPTC